MIRSLARMFAYSKAPRTTFAVLHPRDTLRLLAMRRELRAVKRDMRTARAPRIAAVGAAAVALPLGLALGRFTAGRADRLD